MKNNLYIKVLLTIICVCLIDLVVSNHKFNDKVLISNFASESTRTTPVQNAQFTGFNSPNQPPLQVVIVGWQNIQRGIPVEVFNQSPVSIVPFTSREGIIPIPTYLVPKPKSKP